MEKWEVTQLILAGVRMCQVCYSAPVMSGLNKHCEACIKDCLTCIKDCLKGCKHESRRPAPGIPYEDIFPESN